MKREIWREFQTRFHIRRIGEYYGSTEGNVQTCNNILNFEKNF